MATNTGSPMASAVSLHSLQELPQDILDIIFSYLQPGSFLALCRACKSLYAEYRQDPAYWRVKTSTTFRLPISPLLHADGARWYWLYKRLKTQINLFTWGKGLQRNLGPGRALPRPRQRAPLRARQIFVRTASSWPTETHVPDEVGVIADLQCGGWSTTILTSDGRLYSVGSLDSVNQRSIGETAEHFTRLQYLTQSTSAIRQFSAGRRHVLALTDDDEILSWDRVDAKGYKIFSRTGLDFASKPTRVAAGWDTSSVYVPETGIVYWTPVKNDQQDQMLDGLHVAEKIIPNTAREPSTTEQARFTEVTKHVVLAEFIIWITNGSKLYACATGGDTDDQLGPSSAPFEVPGYTADGRQIKDLQGQYHNFGVFTDAGEVLAGDVAYLKRCVDRLRAGDDISSGSSSWPALTTLLASRPPDVPALQHTSVIQLAYGDHHYHALHATGKITSYGVESESCGSFGLGDTITGARFRGVQKNRAVQSDSKFLPVAALRGRQVWFEPEKREWLQWLETWMSAGFTFQGQAARRLWELDPSQQAAFSEWVEQEGRHWEEGPHTSASASSIGPITPTASRSSIGQSSTTPIAAEDFSHLDAYFAISVAAAGWHSGALVLIDDEKAHATRRKWLTVPPPPPPVDEESKYPMPGQFVRDRVDEHAKEGEYVWRQQGFPIVRLPDGFEMPGVGEVRAWRDGMPTLVELGLASENARQPS